MNSKKNKKILITGCSGLLGGALCQQMKNKYHLIGLFHQEMVPNFLDESLSADIRDEAFVEEILGRYHPDIIVHCAALVNVDACEDSYELAREVNALGTRNLARHAPSEAKFVYISTDAVFDGKKGNYTETDLPCPLNNYAKTKLEGECFVQQESNNYLIIRTNFFGKHLNTKRSFAEWVLNSLINKEPIKMITDWYFSPIFVDDLVKIIGRLLEADAKGLYHVGGSKKCSKYEFGIKLAEIFGLDSSLIEPVFFKQMSFKAKRPRDMSLNGAKTEKELASKLPSYKEGLKRFYDSLTPDKNVGQNVNEIG